MLWDSVYILSIEDLEKAGVSRLALLWHLEVQGRWQFLQKSSSGLQTDWWALPCQEKMEEDIREEKEGWKVERMAKIRIYAFSTPTVL